MTHSIVDYRWTKHSITQKYNPHGLSRRDIIALYICAGMLDGLPTDMLVWRTRDIEQMERLDYIDGAWRRAMLYHGDFIGRVRSR
jgi:hypothetical protein